MPSHSSSSELSSQRTRHNVKAKANPNHTKDRTNTKRTDEILYRKPKVKEQLEYARNGHACLRNLLSPSIIEQIRPALIETANRNELVAWQQKVHVASADSKQANVRPADSVVGCKEQLRIILGLQDEDISLPFLQYFNTWRTKGPNESNDIYLLASRLAQTASILLDVRSVRLYQDALFWKRCGQPAHVDEEEDSDVDGPTPWHVDARMAPFDTQSFLTFWIPLHRVESSGLIFCSKTHSDFALPYWHGEPPSDEEDETDFDPNNAWNALEDRYRNHPLVDYMPLDVGDVTVHSGWTLHCADPVDENSGETGPVDGRMALAISFVDARAPIRQSAKTKGDNEDSWSYRDWIDDVPSSVQDWDHHHVPILWPPKQCAS